MEVTKRRYLVGHEYADTDPYWLGKAESFEIAASVSSPEGGSEWVTSTVEFFRYNDAREPEIIKSCKLNNHMPRTRNCCELSFFSDDRSVYMNTTCHEAYNYKNYCNTKVYVRENRLTSTATRTLTTTIARELEAGIATTERRLPFFLLPLMLVVLVQSS